MFSLFPPANRDGRGYNSRVIGANRASQYHLYLNLGCRVSAYAIILALQFTACLFLLATLKGPGDGDGTSPRNAQRRDLNTSSVDQRPLRCIGTSTRSAGWKDKGAPSLDDYR